MEAVSTNSLNKDRHTEAVIWDVGGVLLRTTDPEPRAALNAEFDLGEFGIEKLVFSSELGQSAQRGAISEAELWTEIGGVLEVSQPEIQRVRSQFWQGDSVDQTLIKWIEENQTFAKMAIISNYADNLRSDLTAWDVARLFDPIVISAEVNLMKPDPDIYLLACSNLGTPPERCVFIDDTIENIETASDLGITGIHFNTETIWTELASIELSREGVNE